MPISGKTLEIYLYLLERTSEPAADEWRKCIVAAPSQKAARERANYDSGSEGYIWTDDSQATCTEIGTANEGAESIIFYSRDEN